MSRRWFAVVLVAASHLPPAIGDDAGRALYESRCDSCHQTSVHNRAVRKSRTVDELRRWVSRWNSELGVAWKDDEIDAVTRHLNRRYYRFPCPEPLCKDHQA